MIKEDSIMTVTCGQKKTEAFELKEIPRQVWSNKLEFLLTLVGTAVGLGNIWRFPYLCYRNGGGAFLIPYILSLVLVGLPTLLLELSIGQFSSLNIFTVWNMAPLFKGLGTACLAVNLVILTYYSMVICWACHYFFSSFTATLPWSTCGNWWNSQYCCVAGLNQSSVGNCSSPSEEYFFNRVLQVSDSIENIGHPVWELVGCLALVWVVVFLVLIKGISSLGKVVYFFTTFPYILLTIMLIRGTTLEGAKDGIYYYLYPNFELLAQARPWSDAATQIFFSLSLSHGPMLSMASFNPFKNNFVRDSVAVSIINCLTSFYGGFAIFSVLGYMSKFKGVPIDKVVDEGPGLVFVVYPEALSQMILPPLWSVFFFLMMITLGLSSMFTLTEVFNTVLIDGFVFLRTSRTRIIVFRACSCLSFFLISLIYVTNGGFYVLTVVDYYLAGLPLLVCAFLEVSIVAFIYGYKRFAEDVEMMLGRKLSIYFRATISFLTPALLLVMLVASIIQSQPIEVRGRVLEQTGVVAGRVMVGVILSGLPLWFLSYYMRNGGWELIKSLKDPGKNWGPILEENKLGIYACAENNNHDNEAFVGDYDDEKDCEGLDHRHVENKNQAIVDKF